MGTRNQLGPDDSNLASQHEEEIEVGASHLELD